MLVNRDTSGMVLYIEILRPSNWHAHLRLDAVMRAIAYEIMRVVKYLLVMPNDGVIDTIDKLLERYAVLSTLAEMLDVKPIFIMTVYLTGNVTPRMIEQFANLPFRVEVKWYPVKKGATTGSGFGIPLSEAKDTLHVMAECGIPLLGHFEATEDRKGRALQPEQRESYFMENDFLRFRDEHPDLLKCIEHASTLEAIARVQEDTRGKTVCTLTPHHLLLSIEQLRHLSWANHGKCMPIPKGPEDVAACRAFATSGDSRAIAGDDTAGWLSRFKQGPFNDAANGAFWTAHGIAAYAKAFEIADALDDDRLERFLSVNGAAWRKLPLPEKDDTVTIRRVMEGDIPSPIHVPEEDDFVVPLGWSEKDDRLRIGYVVE